jgi:hypothetical protein
MNFDFDLGNGHAAAYGWGTCFSRYPTAAVDRRTLVELLASNVAGSSGWESTADFRERTAFTHEMVHYLQDLSTGLGHWDHVQRLALVTKVFPDLSRETPGSGPRDLVAARHARAWTASRLRFVPDAAFPYARAERMRGAMGLPAAVPGDDGVDLMAYRPEGLLEAEAMAVTALMVLGSARNGPDHEMAFDERTLWHPDDLAPIYQATWDDFLPLFLSEMGEGAERRFEENNRTWITVGFRLLAFLIDLACAHPDPRRIRSEADLAAHEPGTRFLAFCRALHGLDGGPTTLFYEHFSNGRLDEAEDVLLSGCDRGYPPSRQVYGEWVEYYDTMAESEDLPLDPVTRLRRAVAEVRAATHLLGSWKTIWTFLDHEIPIMVITAGGIESTQTGHYAVDPEAVPALVREAYLQVLDVRMVDYYLTGAPVTCPRATMQVCDAATPRCRAGLRAAADFPAQGCLVRDKFAGGFGLEPMTEGTSHDDG